MRWYTTGFSKRSGIKVQLECPQDLGRLPQQVETTLFRVVQESLSNVHRHANSPTAKIELALDTDHISLVVSDRGKGFPKDKFRAAHLDPSRIGVGLGGMRERVRLLGGKFEVDSGPKGTKVMVNLPTREVNL